MHRSLAMRIVFACCMVGAASQAHATLKFYYDPLTGNVAFDSTNARGGSINGYGLWSDPIATPSLYFRDENRIRLSSSTLYSNGQHEISEFTAGGPWAGLYTIGDVLPTGLSEATWTNAFSTFNADNSGGHTYIDLWGQGFPPPAEFIYGRPAGVFNNRLDLIDPDALTWASRATLVYHADSGEVVLRTDGPEGGYISALLLASANRFLEEGVDASILSGPISAASSSQIAVFADLIEPGSLSLGPILPSGLSQAEYESLFTHAKFLAKAGFKERNVDFATQGQQLHLSFVAVPEPGPVLLSAVAAIALAVTCRWHRFS